MPTLRPRHMITESDPISAALDKASVLWPESDEDRSTLLKKILEVGIREVDSEWQMRQTLRLDAISAAAGSLGNIWPANWREERDSQWPE